MIVTMRHLRTVPGYTARGGFCSRGARIFFERHHLDWSDFVRNGIDAEALRATGDAMALKLIAHAEKEIADGR